MLSTPTAAFTGAGTPSGASGETAQEVVLSLEQQNQLLDAVLGNSNTFTGTPQILASGVLFQESAANTLTATGSNQGNALALTNEINRFTTVGLGTGALLPPAATGLTIFVVNHGANPLQVYGAGNDTIDDVTNTVGVPQMPGSVTIYTAAAAGTWYSEGIGTGYSGSLPTTSFTDNLSANSGGVQSGATAITTVMARFTTVGGAGFSAVLPTAAAGLYITVINAGANTLAIFPAGSDQINTLPASAAFQLQPGGVCTFFTTVTSKWHTIASQNATIAGATPSAPSGTTSTTQVMTGAIASLTPNATTRALVTVTGMMTNTNGNGATAQIRFGTGTAPVNGAAASGTAVGAAVTFTAITGVLTGPFALTALITSGLTIGTAYWFELGQAAVTGGTATLTGLSYDVIEV